MVGVNSRPSTPRLWATPCAVANARVIELKLRAGQGGLLIGTQKLSKAEQKEVTDKGLAFWFWDWKYNG